MTPAYLKAGLTLAANRHNDDATVRALQRDLRALGYLGQVIDGVFGAATSRAVKALQIDLLTNGGAGSDGRSPIDMTAFNDDGHGNKLVTAATGVLDQGLAQCMANLLADLRVVQLPAAADPVRENANAWTAVSAIANGIAPTPFIIAMIRQESAGRHFHVPGTGDDDRFVTVGLDRNDKGSPDRITSRGYGIGQYTFFHHPPSTTEVADCIADPALNVQQAFTELRRKFDWFVVGPDSRADDRDAEHPRLPLRPCKYQPSNPLYMRDCKACATAARKVDITAGTPVFEGSTTSYQPDQYYPSANYFGVPDRADFLCDWPYAARRYNGSGNNSYHYQTRILKNLLL